MSAVLCRRHRACAWPRPPFGSLSRPSVGPGFLGFHNSGAGQMLVQSGSQSRMDILLTSMGRNAWARGESLSIQRYTQKECACCMHSPPRSHVCMYVCMHVCMYVCMYVVDVPTFPDDYLLLFIDFHAFTEGYSLICLRFLTVT